MLHVLLLVRWWLRSSRLAGVGVTPLCSLRVSVLVSEVTVDDLGTGRGEQNCVTVRQGCNDNTTRLLNNKNIAK